VKAIWEWPASKSVIEVKSFHDTATFYLCFIHNFSLVAPMTDCLKKNSSFIWTDEVGRAFELIKEKLINAPIVAFSNFGKVFRARVWCLRSGHWSSALTKKETYCLSQWKLNEAQQKWFTYEHELYAVYRSLKSWGSYLIVSDFVIFSDHQLLNTLRTKST